MSGSNTVGGHVLGSATVATGATALPTAAGHRSITLYVVITLLSCAALVASSKLAKRFVERMYGRSQDTTS